MFDIWNLAAKKGEWVGGHIYGYVRELSALVSSYVCIGFKSIAMSCGSRDAMAASQGK